MTDHPRLLPGCRLVFVRVVTENVTKIWQTSERQPGVYRVTIAFLKLIQRIVHVLAGHHGRYALLTARLAFHRHVLHSVILTPPLFFS